MYKTLYFLQKNVTKRSAVKITKISDNWITHEKAMAPINNPVVLEFGAGKSLSQNIYLGQNFKSQIVVDLYPMLDIKLFNEAAKQISKLESAIKFNYVTNNIDIENHYKIKYLAPLDVRKTSFPDDHFDGCISTNTLEHIPKDSIIDIFKELRRIVKAGGLLSIIVDYSDHYSHTDRNIGRINFLKYSSVEFKRHNHNTHYQNRMRHYHYEEIFKQLEYKILGSVTSEFADPPNEISSEFDKLNPLLCATRGIFLLQIVK